MISIPVDGLLAFLWMLLAMDMAIWVFAWIESYNSVNTLFRWSLALASGLAVIVAVVATIALTSMVSGGG